MRKYSLYAILVFLTCMACGCSQGLPKTSADVQNQIVNWKFNSVNPLLAYVPENAPIVLATQRVDKDKSEAFESVFNQLKTIEHYSVAKQYVEIHDTLSAPFIRGLDYSMYEYGDDDEDDENVSTAESYEKQQRREERKRKIEQEEEKRKNVMQKYSEWAADCSPIPLDYDEFIENINDEYFNKAYEKTVKLLADESCDGESTCGCRLKEFKNADKTVGTFKYNGIISELNSFVSKYEKYKSRYIDKNSFGFKPIEQQDSVLYIMDSHIVFHTAVSDEKEAIAWMENRFQSGENGFIFDDEVFREEKQINGKNWIFYTSSDARDREEKVVLGVHGENNVITMTFFANHEFPEDVLSIKSKPFMPSQFGTLPADALVAGYVDLTNLGKLFAPGLLTHILDDEIERIENHLNDDRDDNYYECDDDEYCDVESTVENTRIDSDSTQKTRISITDDVCQRDIRDLFSESPKIRAYLAMTDNGLFSFHAYQELSENRIQQVRELIPAHPICGVPEDDVRIELGLKPLDLWKNLGQFVKEKVDKNYQCPATNLMVNIVNLGIGEVNKEVMGNFKYLPYLPIISNFNSTNFIIHDYEAGNRFSRADVEQLGDILKPLLKMKDIKLTEGVTQEIELHRAIGPTQVLLNGNIIVAGRNIDEKDSICRMPEENNMLSAGVSQRFIQIIDKEINRNELFPNLSDVFRHNIQLYTKHENDGFSIHLEEVE